MKEFILIIADIVNGIHDLLNAMAKQTGLNLTDKDLHLWVFGIVGITFFLITHLIFTKLAKLSITAISFIYTFTVMFILVFAVEIQQKITGRGEMDFADAVISLWGFLLFFAAFLAIKGIIFLVKYILKRKGII
ncbi:hypothetical protein [Lederbergia graminis]|uniref:Uncharacterized protein n=1 Tax=Lederbergia graminis TaxID=735518 RepID=A0ABW0LLL1_9BACI|nr:hypothetical protein [Paenibacillus bovis]